MSNWIGAMIGAAIDRQDGDSGIKGAAIGYAAQGLVRVVAPLAVTFAIGWAVQKGVKAAAGSVRNQLSGTGIGLTKARTDVESSHSPDRPVLVTRPAGHVVGQHARKPTAWGTIGSAEQARRISNYRNV